LGKFGFDIGNIPLCIVDIQQLFFLEEILIPGDIQVTPEIAIWGIMSPPILSVYEIH